jgi:hypothetical protein
MAVKNPTPLGRILNELVVVVAMLILGPVWVLWLIARAVGRVIRTAWARLRAE